MHHLPSTSAAVFLSSMPFLPLISCGKVSPAIRTIPPSHSPPAAARRSGLGSPPKLHPYFEPINRPNPSHLASWGYDRYIQHTQKGSLVSVSFGDNYACGVRTDGSVACGGWGEYGEVPPPRH